jgi:hypothetical protein
MLHISVGAGAVRGGAGAATVSALASPKLYGGGSGSATLNYTV